MSPQSAAGPDHHDAGRLSTKAPERPPDLNGLTVAGKTGTAETGVAGVNTAWFIAFAPVADPKIAVAVVVEHTPLFGGQVSAPIAASVIEAYLGQGVAQ